MAYVGAKAKKTFNKTRKGVSELLRSYPDLKKELQQGYLELSEREVL